MRSLPILASILTAALAAAIPSAAHAQQMSEAQLAEMNCVYNAMTAEQREDMQYIQYGTDEEAQGAELKVGPALDAANDACTAQYGWAEDRQVAGEDYAMFRTGYEAMHQLTAPELVAKLEDLMIGFDGDYAYTFTLEGQLFLPDYGEWRSALEGRLAQAGVGEADYGISIAYMTALADVASVNGQWEEMFGLYAP